MRQLLWISDFLHNNEILLDNTLCGPQFVYIIILIGQMHKKDIQVKPRQVFYFSSVKFPGHFKNNKKNSGISLHTGIHLHTYTHKLCTQHLVSQLLTHSGNIVCKLQALFHATKSGIGVIFREYLLSYLAEGSQKHTQESFSPHSGTLFCTRTSPSKGSSGVSREWGSGEVNCPLQSEWKEARSLAMLIFMDKMLVYTLQ